MCKNLIGTFMCICPPGMTRRPDGEGCIGKAIRDDVVYSIFLLQERFRALLPNHPNCKAIIFPAVSSCAILPPSQGPANAISSG